MMSLTIHFKTSFLHFILNLHCIYYLIFQEININKIVFMYLSNIITII
jgi:hypothetical protein